MKYVNFKMDVLHQARKRSADVYDQTVTLLKDPSNFKLVEPYRHSQHMVSFFTILDKLYGPYTVHNAHNHIQSLRLCFLKNVNDCVLVNSRYLDHILSIKGKARKKLMKNLEDLEEFSFLVLEKVL